MGDPRVLVVEDDAKVRRLLGDILENEGASVFLAASSEEGMAILARDAVDIVFTDLRLPGQDGLTVLKEVQRLRPEVPCVLLTGYASLESSVDALRLGATDYVIKPVTADKIVSALARATARRLRRDSAAATSSRPTNSIVPAALESAFLASSQAMRAVLELARRAAAVDVGVLIEGETGVGKEALARLIHNQSKRSSGPFVRVTCGAIREEDLEATLFGRAADGAGSQVGMLAQANRGTLFLHDVAELPTWAQGKLCDALQQCSLTPVGGQHSVAVDVRVIAATRCNLSDPAFVQQRFFRRFLDLINVLRIHIPPLRTRKEDIRVLAKHFLGQVDKMRHAGHNAPLRFADDAWTCLLQYEWPGNVRELANVVKRAALLANGQEIRGNDMGDLSSSSEEHEFGESFVVPLNGDLKLIERHIVQEVIKRCGGNKAAAARSLGLHRKTLYRLMKQGGEQGSVESLDSTPS
jgi:DNA-binding NtrC family response regulator